ncbi:MAG: hypothetical protein ABSB78_02100 [Bacteroidota bacterium]
MRLNFLYLCCVGIILISGCIESFNPVAPSWDVTLNLPLVNHTYTIQDIIQNNPTLFKTGKNGILLYTTSAVIKPTTVGDSLTISDDSIAFQSVIGKFSLKDASTTSDTITLGQIAPELAPANGRFALIPQTPFNKSSIPMDTIRQFREITIDRGTLIVKVKNNLPTAIDHLTLTFFDQFEKESGEILTASFPNPIPSKVSDSLSCPLPARRIGNLISFNVSGILLSSDSAVQIDTSTGFLVGLHFKDLKVTQAEARIPEVTFITQNTFPLTDSSSISSAEIKSGHMSIKAAMPYHASGNINIKIPNLTLPDGSPFHPTIPVTKKQSKIDTTFLLNGYFFLAPQRQINYTIDTRIDDSGADYVILNATDSVSGTVTFSKIILKSLTGIVKPITITVKHTISLDTKSINKLISGTVRFNDASLIARLETPPQGFDYDVNGFIIGWNRKTGRKDSLPIPPDQRYINAGTDSIVFRKTDVTNFLNSFTPNLPDSLALNAVALVNPTGTQEKTIYDTDSISGAVSFELPFNLSIAGGVYQDTVSSNDTNDYRQSDISDGNGRNINSARVDIELENSLPVALGIDTLKFLDKAHRRLFVIPKQGQPQILVQSGVVIGGVVTQTTKSISYIELTHSDATQLDSADYVVMSLHLETPTTEAVRFRSTDWVKVKITSAMSYRANQ